MAEILLVEDSKILAPALMGALELKGHVCLWAKDGVEGVEMAKRELPSLILLDIMLPRVNGIDVCKILKKDDKTWRIPVVIMSTLTDFENKEKAKEAGADYFIEKPYSLQKTVEEILKFLPKGKQ